MEESKRLHRSDPARSAPLRSFSGVFRQEPNPGFPRSAPVNGTNGAAGDQVRDEPVGLAYRVIEKHINEGKQSAGLFNGQPYHTKPATDSFQGILERIISFQSEILPLFIEALTSAVSVEPMKTPATGAPGSHPASNGAAEQKSQAISIEVASSKPVQISIDLKENSERLPLVTLGLRALGKDTPLAGEITFAPETSEQPVQLRISVALECAPGVYSGVVVNQLTGEVRGTLTVRVAT